MEAGSAILDKEAESFFHQKYSKDALPESKVEQHVSKAFTCFQDRVRNKWDGTAVNQFTMIKLGGSAGTDLFTKYVTFRLFRISFRYLVEFLLNYEISSQFEDIFKSCISCVSSGIQAMIKNQNPKVSAPRIRRCRITNTSIFLSSAFSSLADLRSPRI
jgi:hypothetical protein